MEDSFDCLAEAMSFEPKGEPRLWEEARRICRRQTRSAALLSGSKMPFKSPSANKHKDA